MTNHADLIAALRIPMDVTLPGAPELDEYDEQRKAAADALEAVWAEATAAAYGAAASAIKDAGSSGEYVATKHDGTRKMRFDHIEANGVFKFGVEVALKAMDGANLTPQSSRDWLAAHDAEAYRRGQEDMRERAAEVLRDKWASTTAEHEEAIRAIPIKEKDDE